MIKDEILTLNNFNYIDEILGKILIKHKPKKT